MTSFDHVMIPTRGNWFSKNPLEHESDDCTGNTVSSVCVTNGKDMHFSGKFDQHSLYCGSVKPKLKTGPEYWFLWESCELRFPKFTDSFGIVSSNIHLISVPISIPLKERGGKWRAQFVWNQCQWNRDVWIHYDVSLYQRIVSHYMYLPKERICLSINQLHFITCVLCRVFSTVHTSNV